MVAIEHDDREGVRCFVLQPDFGPNWRQTVAVFVLIAIACLGLAGTLAALGLWLVLPFAGFELGLLAWALYASARRGSEREVIRVGPALIEVQRGRRRPEYCWSFQRSWTEVTLIPSGHRWYPSRLILRSAGRAVEVGGFLQEEERVRLARELKRFIGPMATPGDGV